MIKILGSHTFNVASSSVVLGNFDGIHRGHLKLLSKAVACSKEKQVSSVFFTFEPHPSFVLQHKEPVDLIYTSLEKQKVVEELGLDYYIEYPFDENVAAMQAETFVETVIYNQLHAKCIVVGEDYRFGQKRRGDVHMLAELATQYGFELIVVPKLADDGQEISSTRLREAIRSGNISEANRLMGRPFFVRGDVRNGMRIGRTIGIPTANLIPPPEKLLPPLGVYHTEVFFQDAIYDGLTNIGTNPTVNGVGVKVETFLLNFEGDLYGKTLDLDFLEYMRPEIKFDSLELMRQQIMEDIAYVDNKLGKKNND